MATHSSILAWKIQWTEEPGGLQSLESKRVGHDWAHCRSSAFQLPKFLQRCTLLSSPCSPKSSAFQKDLFIVIMVWSQEGTDGNMGIQSTISKYFFLLLFVYLFVACLPLLIVGSRIACFVHLHIPTIQNHSWHRWVFNKWPNQFTGEGNLLLTLNMVVAEPPGLLTFYRVFFLSQGGWFCWLRISNRL